MTSNRTNVTSPDDIDIAALGRAIWDGKLWLCGLVVGAGIAVVVGLSFFSPRYTSSARILIDNEETAFTRPVTRNASRNADTRSLLDPEAVASQVQVLLSRDLALKVVKKLDLLSNAEFNKEADPPGLFKRLMIAVGLKKDRSKMAIEERTLDKFVNGLAVHAVAKSRVIVVSYTSKDRLLASDIANALAREYLTWQQGEKLRRNKDASTWLSGEIGALRQKVSESEAKVEAFRSRTGLYSGRNNVTLNAQQLSELNSQLILAKAQRTEAEARARLIKKMLRDKGDVGAASDVLRSDLIQRLLEQRVQVQRQLAELSATLLPSHPRIKQLRSELADVRRQVRGEANKIVNGLENEAQIAGARENSLRNSLNELKHGQAKSSDNQIKLRALEREAKANRDLLESYLARYRDASARRDTLSVPAHANIISRAHVSSVPSFPKKGPIAALVMAAVALLSLAVVMARALIAGQSTASAPRRPAPAVEAEAVAPRPAPAPAVHTEAASRPQVRPAAHARGWRRRAPKAKPAPPAQRSSALASLDAVAQKLLASPHRTGSQAVLVTGATDELDIAQDAIDLARVLAAASQQVALVDLSEGASSISGRLGLPRMPGIRELAAGQAGFEQVVRLDPESSVQIFAAGNPRQPSLCAGDAKSAASILRALDEAYDGVLLYANRSIAPQLLRLFDGAVRTSVVICDGTAQSDDAGGAQARLTPETIHYARGKKRFGPLARLPGMRRAAAV